jgi:hypothetical protein
MPSRYACDPRLRAAAGSMSRLTCLIESVSSDVCGFEEMLLGRRLLEPDSVSKSETHSWCRQSADPWLVLGPDFLRCTGDRSGPSNTRLADARAARIACRPAAHLATNRRHGVVEPGGSRALAAVRFRCDRPCQGGAPACPVHGVARAGGVERSGAPAPAARPSRRCRHGSAVPPARRQTPRRRRPGSGRPETGPRAASPARAAWPRRSGCRGGRSPRVSETEAGRGGLARSRWYMSTPTRRGGCGGSGLVVR